MEQLTIKEIINLLQALQLREIDLEESISKWTDNLLVINSPDYYATEEEKEYAVLNLNSQLERLEITQKLITWVKSLEPYPYNKG